MTISVKYRWEHTIIPMDPEKCLHQKSEIRGGIDGLHGANLQPTNSIIQMVNREYFVKLIVAIYALNLVASTISQIEPITLIPKQILNQIQIGCSCKMTCQSLKAFVGDADESILSSCMTACKASFRAVQRK